MAVKMGEGEVRFVGSTLSRFERNGYDDSDFFAVVWDAEAGGITTTMYDTTRGAGYGYCEIDATEDVLDAAEAYVFRMALEAGLERSLSNALTASRGKLVRFTRAHAPRGKAAVEVGAEGMVFWVGVDERHGGNDFQRQHGLPQTHMRLGVRLENGETAFVPDEKVEVVDPLEYVEDYAELVQSARAWARAMRERGNWRLDGLWLGRLSYHRGAMPKEAAVA